MPKCSKPYSFTKMNLSAAMSESDSESQDQDENYSNYSEPKTNSKLANNIVKIMLFFKIFLKLLIFLLI